MTEKEPPNDDEAIKNHSLLELSRKIGQAVIQTLRNPAETKELIKTEIRRFRRLMRHKFYY